MKKKLDFDIEFYQLDFDKLLNKYFDIVDKEAIKINNTKSELSEKDSNLLLIYSELPGKFKVKLNEEIEKRINEFESTLLKSSLPELTHRRNLFSQLNKACETLYFDLLVFPENTWLREDWEKSQFFNALVCLKFLQYQQQKINEQEKPVETETTRPLTRKQTIVLFEFLREKKVFNPNKIHQDATKQAFLISAIMGIDITGEVKNSDIYDFWKDVSKTKYEDEYFTLENLNKIERYIKDTDLYIDFQEYKTKAQAKAEIKKIHRGVNRERT